jgi:type I restriction enzyme S subunit
LNKVYQPTFEGLCSAEFIVLPENERIEGAYLKYFLNSAAFVRYTSHLNAGDRPRVDFDQLAPYEIPVPGKDEQRRIVAEIEKQFSRLDEAVANLKRIKANLKRYKAAVLKAAVEGRLVLTEAELARREGRSYETGAQLLQRILRIRRSQWRGKGKYKEPAARDTANLLELPEGWVWAAADQVCSQITDGEHIQPRYQPVGYPMLTAKNVRDGYVSFENVDHIAENDFRACLKRCAPVEGDVLIVSVGATTGRAALVGHCKPFALVRSVLLLRPLISSRFLLNSLQAPWCQTYIRRASGSTAQAHLYIKDTRTIPLPLPPLAEQHRIVAEIDRRLSLVRGVEGEVDTNLKRAERLRQSVLTRAFA